MMMGWLTACITVITGAAVLEDAVETVDYSTALIPAATSAQTPSLDLQGTATPATNNPNAPAATPPTNTPAAPATQAVEPAPPTTEATPARVRSSRAS